MSNVVSRHFSSLRGTSLRLEKWWALQAMQLGELSILERLSAEATEQALGEALTFSYVEVVEPSQQGNAVAPSPPGEESDPQPADLGRSSPLSVSILFWRKRRGEAAEAAVVGNSSEPAIADSAGGEKASEPIKRRVSCSLHEYAKIVDREDRAEIIAATQAALLHLSVKAFPMHEGIVERYQQVLARLEGGRFRGIDEEIADLDEERAALLELVGKIDDYLNWYEVTQVKERSGAFRNYFWQMRSGRGGQIDRTDRISQYLDSLESEFR
jgi:hypothetical protein